MRGGSDSRRAGWASGLGSNGFSDSWRWPCGFQGFFREDLLVGKEGNHKGRWRERWLATVEKTIKGRGGERREKVKGGGYKG